MARQSKVTRIADAAILLVGLLLTAGAAAGRVALCGASDIPLGVAEDTPDADGEFTVSLLGAATESKPMIASEAIAEGDQVYTAADGKVQGKPVVAGTYYMVGTALTAAAADGDEISVDPCVAIETVIA